MTWKKCEELLKTHAKEKLEELENTRDALLVSLAKAENKMEKNTPTATKNRINLIGHTNPERLQHYLEKNLEEEHETVFTTKDNCRNG